MTRSLRCVVLVCVFVGGVMLTLFGTVGCGNCGGGGCGGGGCGGSAVREGCESCVARCMDELENATEDFCRTQACAPLCEECEICVSNCAAAGLSDEVCRAGDCADICL